jgi:hypothetical protein
VTPASLRRKNKNQTELRSPTESRPSFTTEAQRKLRSQRSSGRAPFGVAVSLIKILCVLCDSLCLCGFLARIQNGTSDSGFMSILGIRLFPRFVMRPTSRPRYLSRLIDGLFGFSVDDCEALAVECRI